MTPEQIQLFINAAGSPAAIALGSSPAIIKVFGCIHEYIGLWWGPHQILREAKAQAHADATTQLVKQSLDANATEDERLLARGLMAKEKTTIREQRNKESIVLKALPEIEEDAKPEEVEDDWYANFFDKSRLVSDEEMQMLWGKVLAGEVNCPGAFSKRTLALIANLEKKEAEVFRLLCRFSPTKSKGANYPNFPLLYDYRDSIYKEAGLNFSDLMELNKIGLIEFDGVNEFIDESLFEKGEMAQMTYHDYIFFIDGTDVSPNDFDSGTASITQAGGEIATLLSVEPIEGFKDYLIARWEELGYKVTIQREGEPPQKA